jgi:predicted Zn finger-like uncharacterized protein
MKLTCPTCATVYDIPDNAIGPNGRKVRCRACEGSWFEPSREPAPLAATPAVSSPTAPPLPPSPPREPDPVADAVAAAPQEPVAPVARQRRRIRGPWLLLALVVVVVGLGVISAMLLAGPKQVATQLGLADRRVPLGIAITRQPDWRMIAGGSQLFAVSGRIWNPTSQVQPVPDIRAELKDAQGKTVYAWTITRPVPRLQPGASASFDGAAIDVPASSSNVSVSFAGSGD